MNGNGACAYRQTNIMTAEPKKLILMCYEGAIGSLKQAKKNYESNAYESKARSVERFQDIITELLCALDFERGGEIATHLKSIYDYTIRRVLQADVARDMTGFDEVIGLLEELKEAWEEISYGKRETSNRMHVSSFGSVGKNERQQTVAGTYNMSLR